MVCTQLFIRTWGVEDVLGVDGLQQEATVLDAKSYAKADLQVPFDAERGFDLVVCLEVVEHIDPETSDVLFDSIARHAKGQILFSMAETGQPGERSHQLQGYFRGSVPLGQTGMATGPCRNSGPARVVVHVMVPPKYCAAEPHR